ncbi:MAG TPA: TadE/TadG family type IV pilus assembly protein [Acidobacteriota bacterium]|nr:TadE/TadG family type IV pilus assembly protein [Acidobacteriota bacterium]
MNETIKPDSRCPCEESTGRFGGGLSRNRQLAPAESPRRRRDRGAVIVELAILLPLIVTIFVIIINLGLVIREHQVIQNAAREAARYASLPEQSPNVGDRTAQIRQRAIDYCALENVTINATDITIDQFVPIDNGVTVETGTRVAIRYAKNVLIPAAGLLPSSEVGLAAQGTFRNLY